MLVFQRKSMWRGDTLDMLAAWIELKPGLTVVDVGCGLGFLGYTYWKYFGENGTYVGIDDNPKLLNNARDISNDWGTGGKVEFIEGDAYSLPLPDNCADIAMCQTLLMHLEHPRNALEEMKRIIKPKGKVICFEPDNLSARMTAPYWSLPDTSTEEFLLSRKIFLLANRGRTKLGRGDDGIGCKTPRMMADIGITQIDIRLNDRVHFLQPPYESQFQKDALDKLEKQFFDEERYQTMLERKREHFLAGGGTEEEYARARKFGKRFRDVMRQQLDNKTYYVCAPGLTYAVMGMKP